MTEREQVSHIGTYGIILNDTFTQILLIKKSRGPYVGMLDFPGGRPEFEESFEETLYREILEETGLQVETSKQIVCLLNIADYENIRFRHTGVIYFVKASGNVKYYSDGHDSNGCIWVNLKFIEDYSCTPFVRNIIAKWDILRASFQNQSVSL
ncbi:MAG: hypothetical protein A2007_01170 [Verrucomicrobia bacterium GWC2_42_7]|nr:MAG: hypothetical protein A2007_01170 [Verrucomicrobia bacterium GWC2_42_7]